MNPIVSFHEVSKWYGNVIGLNKLSIQVPAGVTGLLGPDGAGKSTLLQLATGQLFPTQGEVRVLGQRVWNNPALNRSIGLCPEQDAFYEWMTGQDFIYTSARLSGMRRRGAQSHRPNVGRGRDDQEQGSGHSRLLERDAAKNENGSGFGARAAGAVPRRATDRHRSRGSPRSDGYHPRLAGEGKSVLFSSHVLHEVQSMTPAIILLNHGRLVAEGQIRQIRDLIDGHPHHIAIVCNEYRKLAARLLQEEDVVGLRVNAAAHQLMVETRSPTHSIAAARCRAKME